MIFFLICLFIMHKKLNILVIGSGGREHAIVNKCLESPLCKNVIAAPGNGGMKESIKCYPIPADSVKELVKLAKEEKIDFVIVGPEIPLCLGIVDALESASIPAYGPKKDGAQLESSKTFCKDFFKRHKIPTAKYQSFSSPQLAIEYIENNPVPIVIKASGLAAGKGVIIAENKEDAKLAVRSMLIDETFGDSGSNIVIEEYLEGEEVSIHVIVSKDSYLCLSPSQDHKRIGEGDTGPNTGGMGAYAPTTVMNDTLQKEIESNIIVPTIEGLKKDGIDYNGTLYAGLMLTKSGPKILEYNVRFGDPETQAVLSRWNGDIIPALMAVVNGNLSDDLISWKKEPSACVVMVAGGYPGSYKKGDPIGNISLANEVKDTVVFHAGTALVDDQVVTAGGRVLGITSLGDDLEDALSKAYIAVETISYKNAFYRNDIGHRELRRMKYGS